MNDTIIAWTDTTWNPTTGCHKVSAGCLNCYAERLSNKWGRSTLPWTRLNMAENVKCHPDRLMQPFKLKKSSKVFVNSMSDLFHEQIPDDFIAEVFSVMNDLPQHTFQVLTKRPERAAEWKGFKGKWPNNVWMGTSVEDARVKHRIDTIRKCRAKIKFLSCEPLIGRIGDMDLTDIDWVIVGGESGSGYRPMNMEWAREIRDYCELYSTAYFYKQDAAFKTETRPWLVEVDGSRWQYRQFPDELTPPVCIDAPLVVPICA